MRLFENSDKSAFQTAINARIYLDKIEFISYTNSVFGLTEAFICNSLSHRFDKSVTADMLVVYYSRGL